MRKSYYDYALKKIKEGDIFLPVRTIYQYSAIILSRLINRSMSGPLHASIIATYNCNLRCKMCELWKRPIEYGKKGKKELTTPEMEKVIDELADIGTTGIGFTGGEPILRKDMLHLITYAKQKGLVTHMSTNGWLMNEKMATRIIDSGLDAIGFSLDGCNPDTHDSIRGIKGSFEHVITGLKEFIKLKRMLKKEIIVLVVCVISKENLGEIIDIVRLLQDIEVDRISFIPFHDVGMLSGKEDYSGSMKLSNEDIDKLNNVVNKLIEIKKERGTIESSERYIHLFKNCFRNEKLPFPCYAGYATFAIDGYGDMYPCFPMMEMGIAKSNGNIRDMPLKKYWHSENIRKARHEIHNCRKCYWNNQTEINLLFWPFPIPKK